MAYTGPVPTKNVGDTWSATEHNTYIVDNFAAMAPDVFTTKGDLFVASGADAGARLGVGSNNHLLTADSGETLGIKWAANPVLATVTAKGDLLGGTGAAAVDRLAVGTDAYLLVANSANTTGLGWSGATEAACFARYRLTSDQTIATGNTDIINFSDQVFDTESAVTTGASWKFTCPADLDGYYLVVAMVFAESSANWGVNEQAGLILYKNGSADQYLGQLFMQAAGTYNVALGGAGLVYLEATDYIDLRFYQNSGGDIVLDGSVPLANRIAIARLF